MVNKTLSKINQKGSMLVEAMAMLALIALVTPTLYKKSAERTTELQDINTATHIRTLAKAVDNYVSTHYNELLADELQGDDAIKELDVGDADDMKELVNFLPYGYSFDNLKNFGKPKITIKKQGDTRNVTSFVQLPKKIDIGEMRAARIASMVGTNGGYVDKDKNVKGVGGAWGLTEDKLGELMFDKNTGSLVVASIEAINDASLGHMDDDKYLKRIEDTEKPERNEMWTNLSMGGNTINKINQLIVGAAAAAEGYGDTALYIDKNGEKNGAYIGGDTNITGNATIDMALDALGGAFSVYDDETRGLTLDFGDTNKSYLSADSTSVSMLGGIFNLSPVNGVNTLSVEADTDITGSLNVHSSDTLYNIIAAGDSVSLMNGNLTVSTLGDEGSSGAVTVADQVTFTAWGESNLKGKTTIGKGKEDAPGFIENYDETLMVKGDTSIAGDLEANTIYGDTIDFLNLKAGGTKGKNHRWLHVNGTGDEPGDVPGVKVVDKNNLERLLINNSDDPQVSNTVIRGRNSDGGKLEIGDTNAVLDAYEGIQLHTNKDGYGQVSIQDGALKVVKQTQVEGENKKTTARVDIDVARVEAITPYFTVASGHTQQSELFTLKQGEESQASLKTDKLEITGNEYLRVAETDLEGEGEAKTTPKTRANIATNKVVFSHLSGTSVNPILEVDITGNVVNNNEEGTDNNNMASVYIRKGAIEVEHNPQGAGSLADTGMGYVEAGRFVSNALEKDGSLAKPYVATATDGSSRIYYVDGQANDYDRYMVNPAYTSVMHDIKLTTRGGARLSDILPDFINKGIYVVTNTFKDNISDIDAILPEINNNGQVVPVYGGKEVEETVMTKNGYVDENRWASAFLGIVPAPLCPPGYAKVITITPAGFKMAQAGKMLKANMYNPYKGNDVKDDRFYINIAETQESAFLGDANLKDNETVTYAGWNHSTAEGTTGYYLGYAEGGSSPEPLYFQQSTWLRSEAKPAYIKGTETPNNFAGWIAKMGFVYPSTQYGNIIKKLMGTGINDDVTVGFYWNVFPVETATLEGYATAYCYFDRSNIFNSGNNPRYVDQYDQLNNFRRSGEKQGVTRDNATDGSGNDSSNNAEYIERLNDPTLSYTDPW